jgi:hypothetical protein
MSTSLFRQEAINHRRSKIWGEIAIALSSSYAPVTNFIALGTFAPTGEDRLNAARSSVLSQVVHGVLAESDPVDEADLKIVWENLENFRPGS